MMIKSLCTFIFAACVLLSGVSNAADAVWNTKVSRLLTDESRYGLCMAYLDSGPTDQGLNCGTNAAVTFDCAGNTRSKAAANAMFQAAQLGMVTQKTVRIVATDAAPKLNGFCRALRIDIYR